MDFTSFQCLFILFILNSVNPKNIDKNTKACNCALHLSPKVSQQSDNLNIRLWEHSIENFHKNAGQCEDAKVLCANSCQRIALSEFNGLDLETLPKGFSNGLTFGQYICDKIGIDVNDTLISLSVILNCYSVNRNLIEDQSVTFDGNLHSKKHLNCERGTFKLRKSLSPSKFYSDSTNNDISSEIDNWNTLCSAAKSQNNANFKCTDDVIYYFESKEEDWFKARQLCSQKFYGTQYANLVELSDSQQNSVKVIIKDVLKLAKAKKDDSAVDIWTNGVCCVQRVPKNFNIYTTKTDCKWISSGKQIEDQLIGATYSWTCSVLLVTIRLNQHDDVIFNIHGYNDVNSGIKSSYLCTYAKPHSSKHHE